MLPVAFLVGVGPAYLLLAGLVVYLVFYIHRLLTNPCGLLELMLIGFGLGLCLHLWMRLHKRFKRKSPVRRHE
jgi:hypothetical protein